MARKPPARQVRMEDVARRARVSTITVSRALRAPQLVTESTRLRVMRAAAELKYVRNGVAGSLASNRRNVIGAIVPSIRYSALEGMVQGLTDAASERGTHVLLLTSGETPAGEERAIEAVLAQRPDGVCLHGTVHTARSKALIAAAGIPVVETGDLVSRPIDAVVSFSNFAAAKAMTMHLARRGYATIAFAGRPVSSGKRARERLEGYRAALREMGRKVDSALELSVAGWVESAADALGGLLDRGTKVDAVFFASGNMAIGGLMECQRRGIAVPTALAIAGFEDNELAAQLPPGLTTVRIPRYEIGRAAACYLTERGRAGRRLRGDRVDLGFEIVERGSA
jgi:LacI family gluconate utilization system Gnt-I transcriptional repressor